MRTHNAKRSSLSRRSFLRQAGLGLGAAFGAPHILMAAAGEGAVIGEATAAKIGQQILADGGNAVDAAIGAALAACVVSVHNCGIAGYGGHMVIASNGGRKITAIDYNSIAPAAARDDMFSPDANGKVPGRINENGWLAAGVPGTLAGLDLALKKYGTWSFRDAAAPAIELADKGFSVGQGVAGSIRRTAAFLKEDPTAARQLFKDGEPLKAGDPIRNPELAELLRTLADARDATAEFYRGTVAAVIADAFSRNHGLVTRKDLAAYRAREVRPIELSWRDSVIHTAPLTAGGLTTLEVLAILRALRWDRLPATAERTLLRVEALREAWRDRLTLLGDPEKADVPWRRLLSESYIEDKAAEVRSRVKSGRPLVFAPEPRSQHGTVHLSSGDAAGNMVALTLTHGNSFGARVCVDEFGFFLGHGMSRFEIEPGHPNSPGPHKRPLHNMCPTLVSREGRAVLALGGAGGRKIPNSVLGVLMHHVYLGRSMTEALAAARLHTEGDAKLLVEQKWPEDELNSLKARGYTVQTGTGAIISAVWRDPETGEMSRGSR